MSCLRDNKPLWLPVCKFGNLNVYSATKNFIIKNKYYVLGVAISDKSQFNTMNEIWDIFNYNPLSTHHLHIVSQVHEAFTHPQIYMFFQISANSSRKRKAKFTHCVKTVRIRSYSGPNVGKCGFRIRTFSRSEQLNNVTQHFKLRATEKEKLWMSTNCYLWIEKSKNINTVYNANKFKVRSKLSLVIW